MSSKTVRAHEKAQVEQAQKDEPTRLRPVFGAASRKTKALKAALEALHKEVKDAEIFFQHIRWLQERFPAAEYEDVTGLCKLATPAEVKEQDYSLNPGRYVGVVIEEDGKTEEEFAADISSLSDQIAALDSESSALVKVIGKNLAALVNG